MGNSSSIILNYIQFRFLQQIDSMLFFTEFVRLFVYMFFYPQSLKAMYVIHQNYCDSICQFVFWKFFSKSLAIYYSAI